MNQRIIYSNPDGSVAVIIPTGQLPIEKVAAKDVPKGVPYKIINADEIPTDRTFRGAWVANSAAVEVDLTAAKEIGHTMRRQQRAEEFAPLDDVIAKQIPGVDTAAAEEARQEIRDRYAAMQAEINAASTPDEIKAALGV